MTAALLRRRSMRHRRSEGALNTAPQIPSAWLVVLTGEVKTPLTKTLVSAVFKLIDCGNGTEAGSFAFVKNQKCIGFLPSPDFGRLYGPVPVT